MTPAEALREHVEQLSAIHSGKAVADHPFRPTQFQWAIVDIWPHLAPVLMALLEEHVEAVHIETGNEWLNFDDASKAATDAINIAAKALGER